MTDKATPRPNGFSVDEARLSLSEPRRLSFAFVWAETPQGHMFWSDQASLSELTPEARAFLLEWLGDDASVSAVNERDELVAALRAQSELLDRIAATLTAWANESLSGGWSTHQVAANTKLAGEAGAASAGVRAILAKLEPKT